MRDDAYIIQHINYIVQHTSVTKMSRAATDESHRHGETFFSSNDSLKKILGMDFETQLISNTLS